MLQGTNAVLEGDEINPTQAFQFSRLNKTTGFGGELLNGLVDMVSGETDLSWDSGTLDDIETAILNYMPGAPKTIYSEIFGQAAGILLDHGSDMEDIRQPENFTQWLHKKGLGSDVKTDPSDF